MSGPIRRGANTPTPQPHASAVNLLPAPLLRRREGRKQLRRAWFGVVAAGVLTAGAIGASLSATVAARAELTSAQTDAQTAATERRQYADVEQLLGRTARREAALNAANSKHIDWNRTLGGIRSALPDGVTVSHLSATAASPLEDVAEPDAPISAPPVATIELTVRSAALPAVTSWIDCLAEVPGYIDAFPGMTTEDEGIYAVNITLHLDKAALSSEDN